MVRFASVHPETATRSRNMGYLKGAFVCALKLSLHRVTTVCMPLHGPIAIGTNPSGMVLVAVRWRSRWPTSRAFFASHSPAPPCGLLCKNVNARMHSITTPAPSSTACIAKNKPKKSSSISDSVRRKQGEEEGGGGGGGGEVERSRGREVERSRERQEQRTWATREDDPFFQVARARQSKQRRQANLASIRSHPHSSHGGALRLCCFACVHKEPTTALSLGCVTKSACATTHKATTMFFTFQKRKQSPCERVRASVCVCVCARVCACVCECVCVCVQTREVARQTNKTQQTKTKQKRRKTKGKKMQMKSFGARLGWFITLGLGSLLIGCCCFALHTIL